MSSRHPRFVTTCQQVLALGVICAALTPATNVLSLDLVPQRPDGGSTPDASAAPAAMAAYVRANQKPSMVPTKVVDPTVRSVPLTAPRGARIAPGALKASMRRTPGGGSEVLSTPQKVTGLGAVGVTWQHGEAISEGDIKVKVRTWGGKNSGGDGNSWSQWMKVDYHDDHGPDPDSEEARKARPGTDAMLVGRVNRLQVRIDSRDTAPDDLTLAVIDPGVATRSEREMPAIDTATLPSAQQPALDTAPADDSDDSGDSGEATLAAGRVTPKPVIYSRAQWGADESMRDKSSLHYYEVHAGFVHHTVNANNYSRADVPALLRGIYAYHTQSRGWSDIGYNYLVDRFGRIWEGRYGGVDRPVVGAHTLGYNDDSFAMSAIGNYEIAKPSNAVIQAYGALFAWKLSLHGVNPASKKQYVTSRYFQAINGHRDAGATACPGKYLYARLPDIRRLAAQNQVSYSGRQLESNLASTPLPDIVARRTSDQQAFVIPIVRGENGNFRLGKKIATGTDLSKVDKLFNVGDWDRDGNSDLVTRRASDGVLVLRLGDGKGHFTKGRTLAKGFGHVQLLAAVGDVTGDGFPDLMGQPKGGAMRIYPGRGLKGLKASYVAHSAVSANKQIGIGRWDKDGAPDSLFRSGSQLSVIRGNGPGGLSGNRRKLDIDLGGFDWTIGISDARMVGHPDLIARHREDGKVYLVPATADQFGQAILLGRAKQFDLAD